MNLDDFSYTENDRRYINPQVSLAEQNAFINNLRNNQQDWTDETTSVTENLGTKIPSQLGGLTGGSGYFASRYQTPQTNSMVSDLRAAAQSQALSQLMNNEIAKAQKRYNDAYRAAKKREADANSNGGNGNDLAEYLKELKMNLNPDKSSNPMNVSEASEDDLASDPDLKQKLDAARANLRVWEQHRASWDKKNPFEALWTMNEWNNASQQVDRWQKEVARLESLMER
jgi:hypothetical protein